MKKQNLSVWTDFIIVLGVTGIALVLSRLHVLGLVLTPFIPTVLAVFFFRQDKKFHFFALAGVAGLGFVIDYVSWPLIVCVAGPLAMVLAEGFKRKWVLMKVLLWSLAVTLVGFVMWYIIISALIIQSDLITAFKTYILEMTLPETLLSQFAQLSEEGVMPLEQQTKIFVLMIMPSMALIVMTLYAMANLWLSHFILKRLKSNVLDMPEFSTMRLPDNIIMGTTIILLLTLLATQMMVVDSLSLMVNVMYVMMMIFMLQGLTVLAFFFRKLKTPAILAWPLTLVGILFLQVLGLGLLGWVDALFDLRKLRRPRLR